VKFIVVVEDNPLRWNISFSRGSSRQNKNNTTDVHSLTQKLYLIPPRSSSHHLSPKFDITYW